MLDLGLLSIRLALVRLDPGAGVPGWIDWSAPLVSVTRTADELSLVIPERCVPAAGSGLRCEAGWRAFKVEGPLDFALTGILASLAVPLAEAGVPIFAVSTFDTDYLLVRDAHVKRAASALTATGRFRVG